MLNKSVKILSYSALAVTLLMGNITLPTGYFEDEANFSSIPNKLATGWGFSFNKAHADCTVSMDDCITIYGSPPPADPWTGTPEPDPQPEDPTGQEDGGGGGTSSPPVSGYDVAQRYTQCILAANAEYQPCVTDNTNFDKRLYDLCLVAASVGSETGLVALALVYACGAARDKDIAKIPGRCSVLVDTARKACG